MTERAALTGGRPTGEQPARPLADPAAELVRTLTPMIARSVDELHVAAVLESMGVTDQVAHDSYGHDDVFAFADVMFRRLAATAQPAPGGSVAAAGGSLPAADQSRRTLRLLTHGLLYIMPSAVYPAVLIALGAAAMVRGLVFTTAVGWVWGTGMSVVAYQLAGQGKERSAGRALRLLSLGGLLIALLSGIVLASTGPGGPVLVAFAVGQMGFQLMSGVLVLYGKELRLAMVMLPALLAGVVLLATGFTPALVVPTLVAGGLSIVLLGVASWVTSMRAPARPDVPGRLSLSVTCKGAAPSVCYAALCAVFLLFTDSHFVAGDFDLAIAAVPLILGMGTLEWRANHFTEGVSELFGNTAMCAEFRRTAWQLLLEELTCCLAILGSLGTVLLLILHESGALITQGVLLVDAHVLLGGAFFLGFVLARHQQFARLLGIQAAVLAANILAATWVAPNERVPIFLLSTATLLLLELVTLRASFRRVYRYSSAGFTSFLGTSACTTTSN
jgi:hypothetical protein